MYILYAIIKNYISEQQHMMILYFFCFIVLGDGTLWHLQRFYNASNLQSEQRKGL
jgi:hypothetical protein